MAEKQDMRINPIDLDGPLDAIEDLPGFGAWPTGGYKTSLTFEKKTIGENPHMLEITFTCLEVVQVAEESMEYPPPKVGDTCSMLCDLTHKVGASNFKEILEPFSTKFGTTTPRASMDAAKGVECLAMLKRDHQPADPVKNKKERDYIRVVQLAII